MDSAKTLQQIEDLIKAGKSDEAEKLTFSEPLTEATRLAVLATIYMRKGENQKAEVYFEQAAKIHPDHPLVLGNYGQLLANQGKFKAALPRCEQAYKKVPTNEVFAINYANCLSDADRIPEGVQILEKFAKEKKPSAKILLGYSALLRANLESERSLSVLERAKKIYPGELEIERAIADVLSELDPKKASVAFAKVDKNAKNKIAMRWNWSFVELRLGNFRKGWELYENGLNEKVGKVGRPLPAVVRMFKQVTELEHLDKDKYTLFTCEQGLGDQVLFLGCFPEVLRDHPRSLLISEERMLPILRRSFPEIPVQTYGFAYSLSAQQRYLNGVFPIGSFQKNYRSSAADFKKTQKIYLKHDPAKSTKFRELLEKKRGKKIFIGISWSGGFWDRQKKTKSFPFEHFSTLMGDSSYSFVSLQYGDISAEKKYAEKNNLPITFFDGIDFRKDLDSWFSLICACDRVISVSTALVHFAGAAGLKVDVLMNETQGPFIWGLEDGLALPYLDVSTWRKTHLESTDKFFQRIKSKLL